MVSMGVKMGNVWDRAVEFLSDHIALILPIAIFALIVPTSITGSLQELATTGSMPVRSGLTLLGLGFAILGIWAQLAISAMAIDPEYARRATATATARLFPAIGVYLVLFLAVFLVLFAQVFVLGLAGGYDFSQIQWGQQTMQQLQLPPGLRGWVGLLFLVEALVLIGLLARLAPLTGVIVAERRGLGAIRRAFQLTRGLTWKLIGVVILYAVVAWVATAAAQFVFGSIMRIIAGGDGPVTVAGVVTSVVVASVGATFTVLAAAFTAKLYVATARAHEASRVVEPVAVSGPDPLA
jgi:hypothetical protein